MNNPRRQCSKRTNCTYLAKGKRKRVDQQSCRGLDLKHVLFKLSIFFLTKKLNSLSYAFSTNTSQNTLIDQKDFVIFFIIPALHSCCLFPERRGWESVRFQHQETLMQVVQLIQWQLWWHTYFLPNTHFTKRSIMWGYLNYTVPSNKCLICLYVLNKIGLLFFSLPNYQVLRHHGDGTSRKHQNTDPVLFNWNTNSLFRTGHFSQNDYIDANLPKGKFCEWTVNVMQSQNKERKRQ